MKINVIITLMLPLFITCKETAEQGPVTHEDKAKKAITTAISSIVPHPESYQPVSFSTLDSVFTTPNSDSTNYYLDRADYYIDMATEYLSDYKRSSMYSDSSIYFSKKATSYTEHFKKEFTGWKMEHTYQASNSANLMTKEKVTVYFDTSLTIIKLE